MRITELGEDECKEELSGRGREIVPIRAKQVLVGAGARVLFYPTLLYNVVRSKIQSGFRWWDEVDQYILLGAVPFPSDIPRLKKLGVHAVITLNEPFETLVPSSLYQAHGIDHLVIPTRDYLFAPSSADLSQAVDFIHRNTICGRKTYVHCKAGRGRSTTIVLCYLVKYKNMLPGDAFDYVKSIRPRVLLHRSQWKAIQDFSKQNNIHTLPSLCSSPSGDTVIITEADLEGYNETSDSIYNNKDLSIISTPSRAVHAKRPMISMLSCLFASFRVSGGELSLTRHSVQEAQVC